MDTNGTIEVINLVITSIIIPLFVGTIKKKELKDEKNLAYNRREAKKMMIFQLINDDKINHLLDKREPRNAEKIHYEFDLYEKDGGNSWVKHEVAEYDEWREEVKKSQRGKGKKNCKDKEKVV